MNKKAYSFWDNLFLEDGNYKKNINDSAICFWYRIWRINH